MLPSVATTYVGVGRADKQREPMATAEKRWLRLHEAAARVDCSESTLRRRIQEGALPVARIGPTERSPIRIDSDVLERWLQMSTVGGGSFAGFSAMGRSSSVDVPAERDGTSEDRREAVEPNASRGERPKR
jgi:excisionase family DNA binding protein